MFKTAVLLAILAVVFMSIGYLIGGYTGMIIALIFATMMNSFAYWYSDKMVLSMVGAEVASQENYPQYYTIVSKLSQKAGLPMPKLFVINKNEANAFATGRDYNHSSIAVTTEILKILSPNELEGVLAHELAHVKHRDILISTITATFVGAISMIGNMLMLNMLFGGMRNNNNNNELGGFAGIVLAIVAPLFATIIQMAVSRDREYKADKYGGKLCENPLLLASALLKLEHQHQNAINNVNNQHNNEAYNQTSNKPTGKDKALAHMYIINPFLSEGDSLFSTHPATNNRINELVKLANSMQINTQQWLQNMSINDDKLLNATSDTQIDAKQANTLAQTNTNNNSNNPWI